MEIDRRHVLVGASALALSSCGRGEKGNRHVYPFSDPTDRIRAFDAGGTNLNVGDNPWRAFDQEVDDETPRPVATFNPDYIAILHIEVTATPFKLVAKRAHFPVDVTAANDLSGISTRVLEVIKYLHGEITKPGYLDLNMVKDGLYQLGFSRPHHFIIYIKNKGVAYGKYPIWFGHKLLNPRPSGGFDADNNRSFFEAKLSPSYSIGIDVADKFVYVKNYFYTADETNDDLAPENRRKIVGEKLTYALNINAIIESSDNPAIQIPLTIDPDTGNMGGGGGGSLP
ncbi:MAG: hypothetical protein QOJ94_584 [Sphingomonadales bacterium]|jgi:hypothetical protein|nr:hypothetical protein [Sphingomonadales bacterium]